MQSESMNATTREPMFDFEQSYRSKVGLKMSLTSLAKIPVTGALVSSNNKTDILLEMSLKTNNPQWMASQTY